MTIAQEEIFGPVLSIIPYDDEDDAVRIANDTVYGLAGGVWARRPRPGQEGGPPDPHRPGRGQRRRVQPRWRPSAATSSRATAARPASSGSRSSSRSSRCSCSVSSGAGREPRTALRVGCGQPCLHLFASPSPAPPARSATASCSASPAAPCSGPTSPSILQLLEITPALDGPQRRGDGARRLRLPAARRASCRPTTPNVAFGDVDYALLVGAMPRKAGMERSDLLSANGAIFTAQGKALSGLGRARRQGPRRRQPGQHQLPHRHEQRAEDLDPAQFTAMTRLDHNRAVGQLAAKPGAHVTDITKMTIWGNHSATQYPDLFHAEVDGKNAAELVDDQAWLEDDFIPTVQSAARRSSRRAACRRRRRPPTPPSTTCARGRSAPPTATGCAWRCRPTAATACPRA